MDGDACKRLNIEARRLEQRVEAVMQRVGKERGVRPIAESTVTAQLVDECKKLRRRNVELENESATLPDVPDHNVYGNLSLEELRLKTQLDVWRNLKPGVASTAGPVVKANCEQELKENIEQSQLTLSIVREQRRSLECKLQKERALLKESQQVYSRLNDKQAACKLESQDDMHKKLKVIQQECSNIQDKLAWFIQEYLEQASHEEESKKARDEKGCVESQNNGQTLFDLIKMLVEKCLDTPHDPYASTESISHDQLQLMLRAGLLARHPNNPTLVRLTEYHR